MISLFKIISELKINNPLNKFTINFLKNNIKGILSIIKNSSDYVDPNWEISIDMNGGDYDVSDYKGWIISNIDHPTLDGCMCIFITDDLEAEDDGEEYVSSLELYIYKGVKFQAQTIAC